MSLYLLVISILASLFCLSETLVVNREHPQNVLQVDVVEITPPPNNVCEVKCKTECVFSPEGAHMPELDDCYVIADTIRFFSQNSGTLHPTSNSSPRVLSAKTNILGSEIGTPPNNVTMVYSTCKSIFLNQGTVPLEYCPTAWARTIEYMVPFCHGWQRAKASRCVARDQSWSIE